MPFEARKRSRRLEKALDESSTIIKPLLIGTFACATGCEAPRPPVYPLSDEQWETVSDHWQYADVTAESVVAIADVADPRFVVGNNAETTTVDVFAEAVDEARTVAQGLMDDKRIFFLQGIRSRRIVRSCRWILRRGHTDGAGIYGGA